MPDKHVLQKRSRKHDNKLHIETCCDFFIKYLYMKGSSKKQRVSFLGRFLLRNEKMLVYGLKNRGRLIHGIDLYSGKYGSLFSPRGGRKKVGTVLNLLKLQLIINITKKTLNNKKKFLIDPPPLKSMDGYI